MSGPFGWRAAWSLDSIRRSFCSIIIISEKPVRDIYTIYVRKYWSYTILLNNINMLYISEYRSYLYTVSYPWAWSVLQLLCHKVWRIGCYPGSGSLRTKTLVGNPGPSCYSLERRRQGYRLSKTFGLIMVKKV